MFSNILTEFTGKFDSRFITTVFFPCFVFIMVILAVVLYTAYPDPAAAFDVWKKYPVEVQAFAIILFLCVVTLLALAIGSVIPQVIRLYEGYWDNSPLGWGGKSSLFERRKYYYRRTLDDEWKELLRLSEKENRTVKDEMDMVSKYNDIYFNYPPPTRPEEVMPTRLGNIIKSAEVYPHVRYNIDSVLIWPRLYPLLSAEFSGTVVSARSMVDMMLTMSVLGLGLAIFSSVWGFLVFIVRDLDRTGLVMALCLLFFGGLFIFYGCYRAALPSASRYGDMIKVTFDLHRAKLLDSLGYEPPVRPDDEFELWGKVNAFLHRNIPTGIDFKPRKVEGDKK